MPIGFVPAILQKPCLTAVYNHLVRFPIGCNSPAEKYVSGFEQIITKICLWNVCVSQVVSGMLVLHGFSLECLCCTGCLQSDLYLKCHFQFLGPWGWLWFTICHFKSFQYFFRIVLLTVVQRLGYRYWDMLSPKILVYPYSSIQMDQIFWLSKFQQPRKNSMHWPNHKHSEAS